MTTTIHWTQFAEIAITITPGSPAFVRLAETRALTPKSDGCGCGSSTSFPTVTVTPTNQFLPLASKL